MRASALVAMEKEFIRDIVAHPEDDTPRLVLADWLEEQGREIQGEFIRCQVRRQED